MYEKPKSELETQLIECPDQSPALVSDQAVLELLTGPLDRASPTPVGAQLRGAIEYSISCGALPAGTRLPSIRTLAQTTGLAAETVATAYRALQSTGLLVSYHGSGTFVSSTTTVWQGGIERLRQIEKNADNLLSLAGQSGLSVSDVVTMVRSRHALLAASPPPAIQIVMVGIFEEATQAYARDIAAHLRPGDRVDAMTIDQLRSDSRPAPALYVSLPSRRADVIEIVRGRAPVTSISVMPSEKTRSFLAALDPNATLVLVAKFPTFTQLMKSGAQAFAPHIRKLEAMAIDDPMLDEKLRTADTVVYSTGAEDVLRRLPSGVASAEYRHTPDPHAIRDTLIPLIDLIRQNRAGDADCAASGKASVTSLKKP